jgi:hypothetical protein
VLVTGSLKVDVANNSVVVTKYLNPDAIPINGYSGRTKAKVEKATKALKHHSTGTWEVSTALPPPSLPTSCQRQSVRRERNVRSKMCAPVPGESSGDSKPSHYRHMGGGSVPPPRPRQSPEAARLSVPGESSGDSKPSHYRHMGGGSVPPPRPRQSPEAARLSVGGAQWCF